MRDFKGMKRQRGRNRGGNTGGGGSGGGGKPQHNVNRAFESNGPDNVKIRGNAQHVFEKYQQLARDATAAGDRVLGENYLQHAEHYFRVLRAVQPNRPVSEIMGRDAFASGFDIDFEDEGNNAGEESSSEGGESQSDSGDNNQNEQRGERQDRDWQPRDRNGNNNNNDRGDRNYSQDRNQDRYRDERPRDDRQRDDRPRDDQQQQRPRDDQQQPRARDERPRDDRPRDERPRDDRPRDERPREDRPRDDRPPRRDRYGRDRDRDRAPRDPMAVVEPESTPLTAAAPVEEPGGHLRSQDGSLSPAPAFLQARATVEPRAPEPAATEDGEVRKPRRRRAPRSFEGAEGEAPAKTETEEA